MNIICNINQRNTLITHTLIIFHTFILFTEMFASKKIYSIHIGVWHVILFLCAFNSRTRHVRTLLLFERTHGWWFSRKTTIALSARIYEYNHITFWLCDFNDKWQLHLFLTQNIIIGQLLRQMYIAIRYAHSLVAFLLSIPCQMCLLHKNTFSFKSLSSLVWKQWSVCQ